MPSLFNSIFTALSPEYVAIVVAFVFIGQKVLVEKKRVPGVMCVIGLTVGAYLGYGVYGLDMTEVVISGFLVGLGIALMLSIELTMVGYAVLALIAGFFLGHKMGVAFGEDYPVSVMLIFLNLSGLLCFI